MRDQYARKKPRTAPIILEKARANKVVIDWEAYQPPVPAQGGIHTFKDFPISTLRNYIDWTPFFMTWSLSGKYPTILRHEVVGEEAQRLFDDANKLLDEIEQTGMIKANGVCGLFPANNIGDDIEVYTDESRSEVLTTLRGVTSANE